MYIFLDPVKTKLVYKQNIIFYFATLQHTVQLTIIL